MGKPAGSGTGRASLSALIAQALSVQPLKEPIQLLPASHLRASGISKFCSREQVLLKHLQFWGYPPVEADRELIFNMGTGMHYALQNLIMPKMAAVGLEFVGAWVCLGCGLRVGHQSAWLGLEGVQREPHRAFRDSDLPHLVPRPRACSRCGGADHLYREVYLYDPETRISGHPDGFLRNTKQEVYLTEFKSVGSRFTSAQAGPDLDYVLQVQTYLDLLPSVKEGVLLYWAKGVNGTKGLCDHSIARDEGTGKALRELARGYWRALEAWDGVDRSVLPGRTCPNIRCSRAQECHVSELCFEDAEPEPSHMEGF